MEPNFVLPSSDINALPVVEFDPSTSVVEWRYLRLFAFPLLQYVTCIQSNADNIFAPYTWEIVCLRKDDKVSSRSQSTAAVRPANPAPTINTVVLDSGSFERY